MKAYSLDLRQRVVQAVQSKKYKSQQAVADAFSLSLPTVQRWVRLDQQQELAPKPIPGPRFRLRPEHEPWLRAQVEAHPDATLEEHVALWEQNQGQHLSRATMARTLIRLGYSRKKSA